jgi:hypothetical protein
METSIQIFTALSLWVIGISHVVRPRAWAEFFIRLRELGHTGSFIAAFMHLPVGVFVVSFHHR